MPLLRQDLQDAQCIESPRDPRPQQELTDGSGPADSKQQQFSTKNLLRATITAATDPAAELATAAEQSAAKQQQPAAERDAKPRPSEQFSEQQQSTPAAATAAKHGGGCQENPGGSKTLQPGRTPARRQAVALFIFFLFIDNIVEQHYEPSNDRTADVWTPNDDGTSHDLIRNLNSKWTSSSPLGDYMQDPVQLYAVRTSAKLSSHARK